MANTTWNPSDKGATVTLSGGNLIATGTQSQTAICRAIDGKRTGKYYFEGTVNTIASSSDTTGLGVGAGFSPSQAINLVSNTSCALCQTNAAGANVYRNGLTQNSITGSFAVLANGNVICVAADLDRGLTWFRIGASGNWNNLAGADPVAGSLGISLSPPSVINYYPIIYFTSLTVTPQITANFGDTAFVGAVPSGFTAGWPTGTAPNIASESTLAREVLASDIATLFQSTVAREVLLSQVTQLWQSTVAREVLLSITANMGDLSASDQQEIALFISSVLDPITGTLSATGAQDIAAFIATVLDPITGILRATELLDQADFEGSTVNFVTLKATERKDSAAFDGRKVPQVPAGDYKPNNVSVRSWLQLVRDADKDFDLESTRPIAYEFSNGRRFRHKSNPYAMSPGDSHSPGYPGT